MASPMSDLEVERLYHRAIANPSTITRAEYNTIRKWPPPEEEDRISVEKTGYTRAELVKKALATPDDLTYQEARIVLGRDFDEEIGPLKFPFEISRLERLRYQAKDMLWKARSEEDTIAWNNAWDTERPIADAEFDENERRVGEWFAARRLELGTGWMKNLIKNGLLDGECWGFVVFRTGCYGTEQGDEAWRRFHDFFNAAAKATILHYNSGPLLWPKFRAIFVEREELSGASDEQLRTEFKHMRDGDTGVDGHLPKGIRTSVFLVVDKDAIESDAAKTGFIVRDEWDCVGDHDNDPIIYIRALHPDFQPKDQSAKPAAGGEPVSSDGVPEQEDDMAGFSGAVKLALPRVFDWMNFVCFEDECGTAWKGHHRDKGWDDIYTQTKVPEDWIRYWASNTGSVLYKSPFGRTRS